MVLIVTPEVFLDLFLLCAFWDHNPDAYPRHRGIPVSKVARILHGLGIITQKQRANLHGDRRAQRLFKRNAFFAPYDDGYLGEKTDRLLVVIFTDPTKNIESSLLHSVRISLSANGIKKAQELEKKYDSVITKKKYLSESNRQESEFRKHKPAAVAAIMKRYYKRQQGEKC